jgi:hypothetical protein
MCGQEAAMWDEEHQEYFWVVLCKNLHYHLKQSQAAGHLILLGETDSVSPPPHLEMAFTVNCDDCGREYSYKSRELLRYQMEPPASFVAHPLFADIESAPITQQTGSSAPYFTFTASPKPSFTQIIRHLFQHSHR